VPIPSQRDLVEARESITKWLAGLHPEWAHLTLSAMSGPQGTGFSNETLLFDVKWSENGERHTDSLVLRVKPSGYRVFMEDAFEEQYRVLAELDRRGVKVPWVVAYEDDLSVIGSPFYVMRRVEGKVPGDNPPYNASGWLYDLSPAKRRQIWESGVATLCEVHRAGTSADGFEFLANPARGASGVEQQLRYYEESFEWAAGGRSFPLPEAAIEWLRSHLPAQRPTALSWGDARIANMIFDGTTCRAVLDWEMVSLGGPEMDLGWWLFLDRYSAEGNGLARLDGLGSRQETIDLWQEHTGRVALDLEFYEVFAGLRFAVVMMRLAQMFTQWELPVDPEMESNNPVTQQLADLLGLPHPSSSSS